MSNTTPAATGPLIVEQLIQIEARLEGIEERLSNIEAQARARHAVADERYRRTDQYIVGDALNVDFVIKQLISGFNALRNEVLNITNEVKREHHQTRSALEVHMGDPERDDRANGAASAASHHR